MQTALTLCFITLAEVARLAVANHPSVAAAEAEAEAARAAVEEHIATRRPWLGLGATAVHYSDPMPATPIHGFTPGNLPQFEQTLLQSSLSLSYNVYDAGARDARIAESRLALAAAEVSGEAARQTIAARAASTYAAVLARKAILDSQQTRINALETERARVQLMERAGRAARVETMRVDAALAAAEAERVESAATLDALERALARLAGLPIEQVRASELQPASSVAEDTREELESMSGDTPAIRAMRLRSKALEETAEVAQSGKRPQLAATISQLTFGTPRAMLAYEWNAGLQLRWNIFDAGATNARVARAISAAHAASFQADALQLEHRLALDRALADLAQARGVAESLETAVARFEEVTRVEKLRLDQGAGTQTDYLRAEADLASARGNLAAARWRIVSAQVEIGRVTGELTPEWIEEHFR